MSAEAFADADDTTRVSRSAWHRPLRLPDERHRRGVGQLRDQPSAVEAVTPLVVGLR